MDANTDAEFKAMADVYSALKELDGAAQKRVLDYVCRRLAVPIETSGDDNLSFRRGASEEREHDQLRSASAEETSTDDDLEGVSAVARKWMKRSALSGAQLSTLFSLGVEEIDLVASSVPGDSRPDRMRNVLLLQGIAAYLGTGVARVSDEKLRQACTHYDAYDATNFSRHIKASSSDAAGGKENGYTLTSRGITAATELVKQMLGLNRKP